MESSQKIQVMKLLSIIKKAARHLDATAIERKEEIGEREREGGT